MESGTPRAGTENVTVGFLLETLRDALSALAPVAERVGISWREGEAYDDWDDLASSLFEILVSRVIAADAGSGPDVLPLAPYDMWIPSHEQYSGLVMTTTAGSGLAFNKLQAAQGEFAAAETIPITLEGALLDDEPVVVPIASAGWVLLRRRLGGSFELLDRVAPEP